jgi:hypothetical protein
VSITGSRAGTPVISTRSIEHAVADHALQSFSFWVRSARAKHAHVMTMIQSCCSVRKPSTQAELTDYRILTFRRQLSLEELDHVFAVPTRRAAAYGIKEPIYAFRVRCALSSSTPR